jgi:hypothetical protein
MKHNELTLFDRPSNNITTFNCNFSNLQKTMRNLNQVNDSKEIITPSPWKKTSCDNSVMVENFQEDSPKMFNLQHHIIKVASTVQ